MNELRVHKSVAETQMGHNMDKSPKYKLNPEIGWNMNHLSENKLIAGIQISSQKYNLAEECKTIAR